MARDYTKYQVDGIDSVFGKGKLVLAVVQDYCSKNECTFDELKQVFPDEAQGGNTGVFGHMEEAKEIAKKRARHYVKDPITIKDATIAVSTQWGDNLPLFIDKAEEVGYTISTEDSSNSGESESKNETTSTNQQGIPFGDNLFKNYRKNWGQYIIFALDNGGEVANEHPHFLIKLDMINRIIIGVDNSSNYSVGDGDVNLNNSEVELYVDGGPNKCYEGYVVIHCVNEDGSKVWQMNGQWAEFHEKEGELPDGTFDEDVYEVLGNEEDVYLLYELAASSI